MLQQRSPLRALRIATITYTCILVCIRIPRFFSVGEYQFDARSAYGLEDIPLLAAEILVPSLFVGVGAFLGALWANATSSIRAWVYITATIFSIASYFLLQVFLTLLPVPWLRWASEYNLATMLIVEVIEVVSVTAVTTKAWLGVVERRAAAHA
jgi:hypothetical protein